MDHAGGTFSWGEGYSNVTAGGDQPHMWADAQYVNLFRHLFAMEDGARLLLTPAIPRRWQQGAAPIRIRKLPTQFGELDLTIQSQADGSSIDYEFSVTPIGDQADRPLDKIIVNARTPAGRTLKGVSIDGQPVDSFAGEAIIIARPERNHRYRMTLEIAPN